MAWRKAKGLSQEVVGEMLGVSRQMVGHLENGDRTITGEMACKIEQRLGIDRVLLRPDLFRKKAA